MGSRGSTSRRLFEFSALFLLVGCGGGTSSRRPANPPLSPFVDSGFEGAFVSKSFECLGGGKANLINRASEIRRTMLIVSDHILVTDANSFELLYGKKREAEPGMGMVDTVSRYYEVRSRSPVMKSGREGMSIEIVQPSTGAVSTTASSLGERTLSENDFHPVTTALNRSRNLSWTYFFIDRVLHVFQGDLPGGICESGSSLHIVFENRSINTF